jgi:hypothetical protein
MKRSEVKALILYKKIVMQIDATTQNPEVWQALFLSLEVTECYSASHGTTTRKITNIDMRHKDQRIKHKKY